MCDAGLGLNRYHKIFIMKQSGSLKSAVILDQHHQLGFKITLIGCVKQRNGFLLHTFFFFFFSLSHADSFHPVCVEKSLTFSKLLS